MDDSETLYQSYRQSLREFWCIIATCVVFITWTTLVGALTAFTLPEPGATVPTILGMPRWVFFTVLFPWLVGNGVILWFSIYFMKDTSLGKPDQDREESTDES